MLDEKIIGHHQTQLKFHQILYGLLAVFLFILYGWKPKDFSAGFLWVLIGTVILAIAEIIMSKFSFWNRLRILQIFTYIQYIFYLFMLYMVHDKDIYCALGVGALMLVFMFEFSYYSDIGDSLKNIRAILTMVLPMIILQVIYFCLNGVDISGFLLLMAYVMLSVFDIIIVHLFYLNEQELTQKNQELQSEIENVEDNNAELTDTKNRMEKVNEELNLQRVQLAQMNREVKQSNTELNVQADILKYVNRAFSVDLTDIMDYIVDVVIRVRHIEFCGIYIDKGVYYNKKAVYRSKCITVPEITDVKELAYLFEQASDKEDDRSLISKFPPELYPNLSKAKLAAILVMPLVLDGEKYGIVVSGTKRPGAYDSHIPFYDIIVPQFDIAIHNIKLYNQMRHIAQTDGLTGINNRTHFNKLFAEQMEQTVKNQEPLTVALFDIDKFKRINDTYGHLVGDEVIKAIAHLAARHIEEPEHGFICRYGGEEFVIALPNMKIEQALPIIENLHKDIMETAVEAYGHVVTMNVSIGVSSYPEICNDVNLLIKRADWSMYYAKEHGRGQIKVDGPDIKEE